VIRDASPSTHIIAGLPPFLLVHGTDDTRVTVDQSRQFQAKLQAAGNPCDLLLVQGVGHGMVTWEKVDTTYKTQLIEWLRKTMR
jgi:alpha-L-fucosidase 2